MALTRAAFAQQSPQPAKPTLEYRVLVLNSKTGEPEKNWYVTEDWPQRGGMRTDNSGIALAVHYEDNPPREVYVSEWSHANLCANRSFSVVEILKNGIVASGVCDNHLVAAPNPTPGVLVLFAHSRPLRQRFRSWWAEHIYPGP